MPQMTSTLKSAPYFPATARHRPSHWLSVAVIIGLAVLAAIVYQIPNSFLNRDWSHDYLSGRAALAGLNPWAPQGILASEILGQEIHRPYPNPHMPFAVLLAVPLAHLSYETGSIVWLAFEFLALTLALVLIADTLQVTRPGAFGVITALVLLVWPPIFTDLANGQYQCFGLLLLVMAWRSLRNETKAKDISGGLWLGLAIALKMAGLLIIPWALWRRRWTVALAAAASWAGAFMLSSAVIGPHWVWGYYTKVAPGLNAPFLTCERNFSLYSLGYRLLVGTSTPGGHLYPSSTLVNLPWLKPGLIGLMAVMTFAVAVLVAVRRKGTGMDINPDRQIVVLIAASALCLPVAWDYYLILMLPAVFYILFSMNLSGAAIRGLCFLIIAFSLAGNTLIDPFWRGLSNPVAVLITYWPLAGALVLVIGLAVWKGRGSQEILALWDARPAMAVLSLPHGLLAGMFFLLLIHPALPLLAAGAGVVIAVVGEVRRRRSRAQPVLTLRYVEW